MHSGFHFDMQGELKMPEPDGSIRAGIFHTLAKVGRKRRTGGLATRYTGLVYTRLVAVQVPIPDLIVRQPFAPSPAPLTATPC